jgi:hypothetical protein
LDGCEEFGKEDEVLLGGLGGSKKQCSISFRKEKRR